MTYYRIVQPRQIATHLHWADRDSASSIQSGRDQVPEGLRPQLYLILPRRASLPGLLLRMYIWTYALHLQEQ